MIINDEKGAPTWKVEGEDARLLKVLLSPKMQEGLTELAVGYAIVPPGGHSDKIGHPEGELFYVVSGEGKMYVDGEIVDIHPTTTFWVPPYKVHQSINDSDQELKILWVLVPPGKEEGIIEKAKEQNA